MQHLRRVNGLQRTQQGWQELEPITLVAVGTGIQQLLQAVARQVRHDQVGRVESFDNAVDFDDIRMLESRQQASFGQEAVEAAAVLRAVTAIRDDQAQVIAADHTFHPREFLDRHIAIEHQVSGQVGDAEPAMSEYAGNAVTPDLGPWR